MANEFDFLFSTSTDEKRIDLHSYFFELISITKEKIYFSVSMQERWTGFNPVETHMNTLDINNLTELF